MLFIHTAGVINKANQQPWINTELRENYGLRLKNSLFLPILPKMNERESWEELQERLDVLNGLERQVPLLGKNGVLSEVPRQGAARMYRKNWDGCRDLWKLNYRQMKERHTNRS